MNEIITLKKIRRPGTVLYEVLVPGRLVVRFLVGQRGVFHRIPLKSLETIFVISILKGSVKYRVRLGFECKKLWCCLVVPYDLSSSSPFTSWSINLPNNSKSEVKCEELRLKIRFVPVKFPAFLSHK